MCGTIETAPYLAISIATVWELEIKRGMGKLGPILDWNDITTNHVALLGIEIEDTVLAGSLRCTIVTRSTE